MGSVVWINHEQGEKQMLDTLIALSTVIGFAVFAFYVRRRMDNRPKIRNGPVGNVPYRDVIVCGTSRIRPTRSRSKDEEFRLQQRFKLLQAKAKSRSQQLNANA